MGGWGMMDHFVDNKLLLSHSKAPACGAEEGGATELAVVGHRRERMPGWAGTARPSVLAACTWIVDSGHTSNLGSLQPWPFRVLPHLLVLRTRYACVEFWAPSPSRPRFRPLAAFSYQSGRPAFHLLRLGISYVLNVGTASGTLYPRMAGDPAAVFAHPRPPTQRDSSVTQCAPRCKAMLCCPRRA